MIGHIVFFGLMFFLFGHMVIYSVVRFYTYSVLWIWSNGPAWTFLFARQDVYKEMLTKK